MVAIDSMLQQWQRDGLSQLDIVLSLHSTISKHSNLAEVKGFKCNGGIMASEAVSLFRTFYEHGNPNAPKPHRSVVQP
ncbi:unnamed protein product [Amaranthus hypochondriacus]